MKRAIGKNTLGGGNKMNVSLRKYTRSTHNLSEAWRSDMGVGTLVPFLRKLALPGDTWDLALEAKVTTDPTIGPLLGQYKLQLDVFTCPIRLYNAMLHNNTLGIGLDMKKVKLPQMEVTLKTQDLPTLENGVIPQNKQISQSSLLAYLGLRGWGGKAGKVQKNAVPLLSYWDIFKGYYANKQEEDFYVIDHKKLNITVANKLTVKEDLWQAITGGFFTVTIDDDIEITDQSYQEWTYQFGGTGVGNRTVKGEEIDKYFTVTYDGKGLVWTFNWKEDNTIQLGGKTLTVDGMTGVRLRPYKLEEIDQIRETILGLGRQQAIISAESTDNVKSDLLKSFVSRTEVSTEASKYLKTYYKMQGLAVKTHQSDVFTNWVNNEWIDGENGINAITAIDTSSGKVTIDQINLSKKVYDMLNRIAVSGGTYEDWIKTVYTSNYTPLPETPVYEGGMSQEIVFQEVTSYSATAEQPLGTLAAKGTLGGQKKGGRLHIKVAEPCYLIGIVSITPRVDYCQQNEWDMELKTMDDLHKPQLDGIGFQDLTEGDLAWWTPEPDVIVGKQPAWINYMTAYNKTYGSFAEPESEAFMCLNRFFYPRVKWSGGQYDYVGSTSYINPADFNYTFAETKLDSMNFRVQIGTAIHSRRVMSAKQIPNL